MKQSNLLLITTIAMILTACSSGGSSGGISTTTNPTGNVNGLTQNYTVPNNLKSSVTNAKRKIFWEKDPSASTDILKMMTNGKTRIYKVKDIIDYNKLPQGLTNYDAIFDYAQSKQTTKGKIYNMPYSLIIGDRTITDFNKSTNQFDTVDAKWEFDVAVMGLRTQTLPNEGKATYTGFAMDKQSSGKLEIVADFTKKAIVSGSLTGLAQGDITFKTGEIKPITVEDVFDHPDVNSIGFIGEATGVKVSNSENIAVYAGQFFGPNAEEVAGIIEEIDPKVTVAKSFNVMTGDEVRTHAAFGGQRGSIQK